MKKYTNIGRAVGTRRLGGGVGLWLGLGGGGWRGAGVPPIIFQTMIYTIYLENTEN